jgi:bifunctional non-homologous end joining protein LigD
MDRPLSERRAELALVVAAIDEPLLVLSEGVVGGGVRFFDELVKLELEGLVAKRLSARYQAGRRTEDWVKVKRSQELVCAVIGYVPEESGGREVGFKSLVIAAELDGGLRSVGRVGGGISRALHDVIWNRLRAAPADGPLVDPRGASDARWVEPVLYCRVAYLERTKDGNLRAPVFQGLVDAE